MNKMLLLDSDNYFALSVKMLFSQNNIETEISSDGKQAMELLQTKDYDVIICSNNLMHKNALEMATYCKQISNEKNIPFILVSASNTDSMNSVYQELNPDAFFHKPIDIQALLNTISNIQLNKGITVKTTN